MELINLTSYAARPLLLMDLQDRESLVVVVKATFDLRGGAVRPHDEQEPVHLGDAYHGEPGESSVKAAGDAVVVKPAADVVLVGSAYTRPGTRHYVDVRLRFGALEKYVRVFGNRWWRSSGGVAYADAPEPFERMPLVWERAYGGTDDTVPDGPESYAHNPVGVGFRGRSTARPIVGMPLPNLEDPYRPIRAPGERQQPASFGFVAPGWQPRASWTGTYDDAWQTERAPLLPRDFDPRFFQCAPPDQIQPGEPVPGTPVEVDNASPGGRLAFQLPDARPAVTVNVAGERHALVPRCDTVVIDGDAERLIMVWRASLPVQGRVYAVEWIRVNAGNGARHG